MKYSDRIAIPSSGEESGVMRFVGWHDVLEVGAGFVEEVVQDGAGDNVRCCWSTLEDCVLDNLQTTVPLEFLILSVSFSLFDICKVILPRLWRPSSYGAHRSFLYSHLSKELQPGPPFRTRCARIF